MSGERTREGEMDGQKSSQVRTGGAGMRGGEDRLGGREGGMEGQKSSQVRSGTDGRKMRFLNERRGGRDWWIDRQ